MKIKRIIKTLYYPKVQKTFNNGKKQNEIGRITHKKGI